METERNEFGKKTAVDICLMLAQDPRSRRIEKYPIAYSYNRILNEQEELTILGIEKEGMILYYGAITKEDPQGDSENIIAYTDIPNMVQAHLLENVTRVHGIQINNQHELIVETESGIEIYPENGEPYSPAISS